MNATIMNKVYSVNGILQAVMVQDILEKAGIQVVVVRSDSGFDIMAPAAQASEAIELLRPECRFSEVYFIPSHMVNLTWAMA